MDDRPDRAVARLRESMSGEILTQDSSRYVAARTVFHSTSGLHPAYFVRCANADDVRQAVLFAREQQLPLSVRAGGHHSAALALNDGGVVVDLSLLRGAHADASTGLIVGGGGSLNADWISAADRVGGTVVTGTNPDVGTGILLGGGIGYTTSTSGLSCDRIVSAELVTADGELLSVDSESDPELLWALRGAGPNFGVVTSLTLRLREDPGVVHSGEMIWDGREAERVMTVLRDLTFDASDRFGSFFAFLVTGTDRFGIPEELHGRLVLRVSLCHLGSDDEARDDLAKLRAIRPAVDTVAPHRYHSLYEEDHSSDGGIPTAGARGDEDIVGDLTDELIQTLVALGTEMNDIERRDPGDIPRMIAFWPYRGEVARQTSADSMFGGIGTAWGIHPHSYATHLDDAAERIWTAQVSRRVAATQSKPVRWMPNTSTSVDGNRPREIYGEHYDRLVSVKNRVDPANVFRRNVNVTPTA